MHIHLCQHNIEPGSTAANRRHVREIVLSRALETPGILLLPEIFSTGVLPADQADAMRHIGQDDRSFISSLAKETGLWVLGTTADGSPGSLHNLSLLYDPEGIPRSAYRKMHPFSFSGEHLTFACGNEMVVTDMAGFRLQQTLCYDLRFPELFRAGVDLGATFFTVQANWPANRQMHWETLLRARAIENQAFVAGVNCLGNLGPVQYRGGSTLISPRGEILVQAGEDLGVFSGFADPDLVAQWRRIFPALQDRRPSSLFKSACA